MNQTNILSVLSKLRLSQGSMLTHCVHWLTRVYLNIISLHPSKGDLIQPVFKNSLILLLYFKHTKHNLSEISCMLVSAQKNKWTTLIDKLLLLENPYLSTLHINLLQMLLQELILKEKALQPFWNPAYKALSEKLSLLTEIDYADSDLNLLNCSSIKQEVKSPFLTIKEIETQNKNYRKTSLQSYISTRVDKWESENIKTIQEKTVRLHLKLNTQQKEIINEWIDTSRYVYNKTLIKTGEINNYNFMDLRDVLVTNITKMQDPQIINIKNQIKQELNIDNKTKLKEQKKELLKTINKIQNTNVEQWELNTPKEIRASAVKELCNAYKTARANLKNGNIKEFKLKHRLKKQDTQHCKIPKSFINNENGCLKIAPTYLKDLKYVVIGKRNRKEFKNLNIDSDTTLLKRDNKYILCVPVKVNVPKKRKKIINVCGIDPGIRTFLTIYSNRNIKEQVLNKELLKKLNDKIDKLKALRKRRIKLRKIEKHKENIIDGMHWGSINSLTSDNDLIFFGNIESQDIKKKSKNSNLNRALDDLKFYKYKQRLEYKALMNGVKVIKINEAYTSKTCCRCGIIKRNLGSDSIYKCNECQKKRGRDINAAMNIFMKGILTY